VWHAGSLCSSLYFPFFGICLSPTDLLRDFSGSRNVRVARGQKECLSQRPLGDTERNAQANSAGLESLEKAIKSTVIQLDGSYIEQQRKIFEQLATNSKATGKPVSSDDY